MQSADKWNIVDKKGHDSIYKIEFTIAHKLLLGNWKEVDPHFSNVLVYLMKFSLNIQHKNVFTCMIVRRDYKE